MAGRNPLAAVAHGHTLAEAIVDTVREPLVVLDRDLRVIAASRSFYRTFAAKPGNTEGRMLYELGDGQWNIPALRNVLEEVIPKHRIVEAYEVEHEFPTIGRRVMLLNARQVFDEDGSATALLLAIEDVTERRDTEREKDELLRQKERDSPAPGGRPPARHVSSNGATTAPGLGPEREHRDRALSIEAVRQPGQLDDR